MSSGDRLVLTLMGDQPTIDLASLQGHHTIPLKWYATADLSRSIFQRRKTSLDYIYTHQATPGFVWEPSQMSENKPDGSHDNVGSATCSPL
jgi:hypothetical protein